MSFATVLRGVSSANFHPPYPANTQSFEPRRERGGWTLIPERSGEVMDDTDTCDRCGPAVRAWVYVSMPSDLELTFCGHCGRRFREALIDQGAVIIDLTHMAAV